MKTARSLLAILLVAVILLCSTKTASAFQQGSVCKVTCPNNYAVFGTTTPQGFCEAEVDNIGPIVSDSCGIPVVTYSIMGATMGSGDGSATGTIFNQGVSTVVYRVVDLNSDTASCSFTVHVECNWVPDSLVDNDIVPCGADAHFFARVGIPSSNAILTIPVNSFPTYAIVHCGKYDVYFEDLIAPVEGFGDPSGNVGAARINTLCAVLTYLQSVFDYSSVPANAPIRLYVNQSYGSINQAPATATYLAFAGPFYNNTGAPHLINGFVFDYLTTGLDPANVNGYHAELTVNFDQANGLPIDWLSDYLMPIPNCYYDLYSVLLHEMGHTLGWMSFINYDSNNFPHSVIGNNQYSGLDYTYYSGATPPFSILNDKLVIGSTTAPQINTAFANSPTALDAVWTSPNAAPKNDPVYSGSHSFVNGFGWPFAANSILSHLDEQMWLYSTRSRISPGDVQSYVMAPYGVKGILRRIFTDVEINKLLDLGYVINSGYTGTTLGNFPPYSSKMAGYNNIFNNDFPEAILPDFTLVNNVGSSLTINLATDPSLSDLEGDPISVFPGSLTNIRGCGSGGNNHNQLSVSGQTITYTPRPDFYGRAQFGFKLFDGKEAGSYHIYTIDVQKGTNNLIGCTVGANLILNGDLEEGTEVKQLGANESVDASVADESILREGKMRQGIHFADAQPYCYLSNNWGPFGAGEKIKDSRIDCNGSTYKSDAGAYQTSIPGVFSAPNSNNNIGERFKNLAGPYNYFNLCSDVQNCHQYTLEFDYYACNNIPNGTVIPITIGFTNGATFPGTAVLTYSFVYNLTTVGTTWLRVSVPFTYCGSTPAAILNLQQPSPHYLGFLVDNLSLVESTVAPPPLTVNISPSSPTISVGGSVTLTANVANALCNLTYNWSPGTTPSILVSPTVTTTYTVVVNDGCRNTTASVTVTVLSGSNCNRNQCLDFDGNDDIVVGTSPLPVSTTAAFSVGCWFRDDRTLPVTNPNFFQLFGFSASNNTFLELGDQNGFLAYFTTTTTIPVISTTPIRDGKWHYLVTTVTSTATVGTLHVYLDGVAVPGFSNVLIGSVDGSGIFLIGDLAIFGPRSWLGRVDEFKIWDKVLSPVEVVDAMLCSADQNNSNLKLHFPLDQSSGTTATDVKGSNNATLSNFALTGTSSNWVDRGVSLLPDCQVGTFGSIEGNPGINTAYRTKVYNGFIYSLSLERTAGTNVSKPAFIKRTKAGAMVWRTVLEIPGVFNDFVMTEDGCDFLLVGEYTGLVLQLINNTSFVAKINDLTGALAWKHEFNVNSGRESFTRILLSDHPSTTQPGYPYVVLGVHKNNTINPNDIILFTMDGAGLIGQALSYGTPTIADDYSKDLVQMQGDYVLAGNLSNRAALVFTNNNLAQTTGFPSLLFQQTGIVIWDVEPTVDCKHLLLAGSIPVGNATEGFLARVNFSNLLVPSIDWVKRFPGIRSFRKITTRPNGDILALGVRPFSSSNPQTQNVVVKGQDNGNNFTLSWLKYLYRAPENAWSIGDIVQYNGQRIFYTDGRLNNPSSFGNRDILSLMGDNDFTNVSSQFCLRTEMPQILNGSLPFTALQPIDRFVRMLPFMAGGTTTNVPLPQRPYCSLPAPCECAYTGLAFSTSQQVLWKNFPCGNTPPLELTCPGQNAPIYFSGKLACMGDCGFMGLSWTIRDPNNGLVGNGSSLTNPAFAFPLNLSMVQSPGIYTIELTGKCGTTECKCIVQFKVNACPKPCACNPLSAFNNDVNMGFNYIKFPAPSCKFQFTPKKLTDCDRVEWKIAKASDLVFTIVGSSVGNTPFSYTFQTDLTQYVVCMTVTRTEPGTSPPVSCMLSRCYTVDLDCSLFVGTADRGGTCTDGVVDNDGFTEGAQEGGLLSGGMALDWNASDGDPEVVLEPGQMDANFVRLRGNDIYSDKLYQDSIPALAGKSQLRFGFRPIAQTIVGGSELVVRLSSTKQDSAFCIDDCQEIMRFPIPELDTSFTGLWLTAFGNDSVTVAGKYLTFHVENPFTDDDEALKSVIDIDNICLRKFNFVSSVGEAMSVVNFQLFPNPTTGELTIEWPGIDLINGAVIFTSSLGQTIRSQRVPNGSSNFNARVADFQPGIYFVRIMSGNRLLKTLKFVKQ